MKVVSIVLFLNCIQYLNSAKILVIFPSPGYSQFILGKKLVEELVARKHDITLISAYKPNLPDEVYKHISTAGLVKLFDSMDLFEQADQSPIDDITSVSELGVVLTEYTLSHPDVQKLIKSKVLFDLVVLEQFFDEALMGFAHHFQAPLILLSSMGSSEWTNHLVGNPGPYSHVPLTVTTYTYSMTYLQRLKNSLLGLFDVIYKHTVVFPKQNELLQKFFPNPPDLKDIIYNASILFLNSHPSVTDPVPHVPNMIEIGGFHITQKTLPRDVKNFLDDANEGAIFFSMGTNLKSSNFPQEKLRAILNVFSKIPQKILWKFEDNGLDKPKNLKIAKWLPQSDILGHPNIKAFISHCGLLSTLESVHHGVPIVAIPIFADQKMNTALAVQNGYAIYVPFDELNESNLFSALNEIINNRSYRETAKSRSRIMHDRPIKPVDSAMYWIEYVIRHRGAPHLRTKALELTWYQYLLLDVICSFIFVILILFYLFRFIIATCVRKTLCKHKQKFD